MPLFIGLSVEPYVYIKETPTGPDAGKTLQPPLGGPPAASAAPAANAAPATSPGPR
jgi:membrane fusion protein, multidrug efflux system